MKSMEVVVVGIEISPFYSGSNHMDGVKVVQYFNSRRHSLEYIKVATQTLEQFHLHWWPHIIETSTAILIASTGDY